MGSERDKTKAKPKPQTKPNNNTTRMHLEGEIRPPGCPDISKRNIAKSAFFIVSGQSPEDHAPSLLFLPPPQVTFFVKPSPSLSSVGKPSHPSQRSTQCIQHLVRLTVLEFCFDRVQRSISQGPCPSENKSQSKQVQSRNQPSLPYNRPCVPSTIMRTGSVPRHIKQQA